MTLARRQPACRDTSGKAVREPAFKAATSSLLALACAAALAPAGMGLAAGDFKRMDGSVQLQERSGAGVPGPGDAPAPRRRLGFLSGRFKSSEPSVPLPEMVTLRVLEPFIPYPGRQPKRRLFQCPLNARGAWSCVLPAATYDLAVGAKGFVPQRRPKTVVQAGRELELGTFELEPSQSIAGWLAVDEGKFDASTLLLRVVPMDDAPNRHLPVYQGDPLLVERTVKSDGSFRIANVRAGTWNVEARSPGYLTALGTPVQVVPRRTTVLEQPLILHRPFDLEVVVEPPVDGQGRPWVLSGGPIRTFANGRQTRVPETFEVVGEGKGLYRLTRQGRGASGSRSTIRRTTSSSPATTWRYAAPRRRGRPSGFQSWRSRGG